LDRQRQGRLVHSPGNEPLRCSAPKGADRIAVDLVEQFVDPPSRAEQRVALPTTRVPVVVERPEPSRTHIPKPRDRQATPVGPVVLSPRWPAFDDRDRLSPMLQLDPQLVPSMIGNPLST